MNWFTLAIFALPLFAVMTLIQKHVLNQGTTPIVVGVYLQGISFIFFLIMALIKKESLKLSFSSISFMILAGLFALIAMILTITSFQTSPNPGYTQAIISANAILVLFCSWILFSSEISSIKLVGVLLTIIGVVLIGWK